MPPKHPKGAGATKRKQSTKKDKETYDYDGNDGLKSIRNAKERAGDVSLDSDSENEGKRLKDDESIDDDGSDVGWDSDDELAYGSMLRKQKGKSIQHDDDDDEAEAYESDEEELGDGEMFLSDLLDKNTAKSSSSKPAAHRAQEEEDEDEEGDEDDEGSDEDEDDLDEIHNRLLTAIDRFAATGNDADKPKKKKSSNQNAPESIYSSTQSNTGSGGTNNAVSLDALLSALDDTRGMSVVKARLAELEKGIKAPVYVDRVISERAERTVTYEGTSKDMGKWQSTVTTNRHLKTLDLAQDKRELPSYKSLVKKFEPMTDMEKEIKMVLVQTGGTERGAEQHEEDELGSRNVSVQELRARQAELAKVKALLFYEQMKRHRLNKIKSKAYHRIRKRQRLRKDGEEQQMLAETDHERAAELAEAAATRRVKERMDLKHSSGSAWARNTLLHAHGDKSMREAYHETVLLGHELTKKIEEDPTKRKTSDGIEVSDDDDSEDEDVQGRQKVSARAAKAYQELATAHEEPQVSGKYKKLFELDFMKKAAEAQREKAREEVREVLRDIRSMEKEDEDDEDPGAGAQKDQKEKDDAEKLAAARREMDKMFATGGSVGLSLKMSRGKVVQTSSSSSSSASTSTSATASVSASSASAPAAIKQTEEKAVTGNKRDRAKETDEKSGAAGDNPWLVGPSDQKKRGPKKQKHDEVSSQALSINASIKMHTAGSTSSVSSAVTATSGSTKKAKNAQANATAGASQPPTVAPAVPQPSSAPSSKKEKVVQERKPLLMQRSQEDLVQIAFAGPDYEQDFDAYKKNAVDAELGIDEKKMKILKDVKAGWGDWAGPGANLVSDKILKTRDRLIKAAESEADEKRQKRRDTKQPNVILSDRRIKTAAKFKIAEIPHPYTTREEYERSLAMPIGEEYNASHVVKAYTKPEILLRAGRLIEPIKLPKQKSAVIEQSISGGKRKKSSG